MSVARMLALAWLALHAAAAAAVTSTVVDVPTRKVTQRFVYVRPDAPIANVVALADGDGVLGVQSDGSFASPAAACFPVARARPHLAQLGFALALVDAASDGVTRQFEDVLQVVRYIEARDDVPTWIVAGPGSTAAALDVAARLPPAMPVGVILYTPDAVDAATAASVSRPVQVVTNAADATSTRNADALYAALPSATPRERVVIDGGDASGCGYRFFGGAEVQFAAATSLFMERNSAVIASAAPDTDQHGLTGLWYEPAKSGQGFAFEVYRDLLAPGTGLLSGGWFTFDTAPAGGADRQRWYSVMASVPSGATSASATLYQSSGGNFGAPPTTTPQTVGTAQIEFSTCDSAIFTYALADGRWGSIPLTRATRNVECSSTAPAPANADFGLSGNWFDPATAGQGVTVEANPASSSLFFAWYTFAPNAASSGVSGQRWYTGQASYASGARSATVTLYETAGGLFDAPTPASQHTTAVGTATLTFQSCVSATLAYAFSGGTSAGLTGTIALQRAGPTPADCSF